MNDAPDGARTDPGRDRYDPPLLTVLGTLAALTQGSLNVALADTQQLTGGPTPPPPVS